MRRLVLRALAVVAGLLTVAVIGTYMSVRRSLPTIHGTTTVPGISAPVDIVRDADAIPHIFASTKADALFGLGYVHAQDRLWQMEFQRRIGHGRLSEVFGEATIPQDRFLRTVGFGRAARSAWDHLPEDARQQIDAYCAGVNAFISTHHGRLLPPEFTLLRFEPEPFTGPDVLVWVKMMAWDLSANYTLELMRHDITAKVGPSRMAALLPPYPINGLSIVGGSPLDTGASTRLALPLNAPVVHAPEADWAGNLTRILSTGNPFVRDLLRGGTFEALGSNNWVVDGTLSATGKPLLANDPHLGTHIPSTWYLAHVKGGDFEVI